MATFTEFCCRSGGSNLNAGTRTGNSTEPGTTPSFAYNGTYVQSTRVFTVTSGAQGGSTTNPQSDGVVANDYASLDTGGATAAYIVRVSSRNTTTITLAASGLGTNPADGTMTLRIGGAWKGPNAAEAWPFGQTLTGAGFLNASANPCRINFKNDATYSITSGITHSIAGPAVFQGYTSSYDDLGRATLDGSTNAIVLLTISGGSNFIVDFIFSNNGTTGSNAGLVASGANSVIVRCVAHDLRGFGISCTNIATVVECECYACNGSNTASTGGFNSSSSSQGTQFVRCISHDNTGSNSVGFISTTVTTFIRCIADTNGSHGWTTSTTAIRTIWIGCDAYNNGGDGIRLAVNNLGPLIESCNFIKNGTGGTGYGINVSTGVSNGYIFNCGFGSGTQANATGTTNITAGSALVESGSITYASGVTPWVDPANGDFRVNLAAAKGAGRGTFTETAASYAGTVGYPDVGAGQHQDSGGGGGMMVPTEIFGTEFVKVGA